MRKLFFTSVILLLLSLPFAGHAQQSSITFVQGGGGQSGASFQNYSMIPNGVLIQVLTAAAPSFGYSAGDFIQLYSSCGCIVVEEIGPSTYFVSYGGLGIQVIIDGGRRPVDNPPGNNQPFDKKR